MFSRYREGVTREEIILYPIILVCCSPIGRCRRLRSRNPPASFCRSADAARVRTATRFPAPRSRSGWCNSVPDTQIRHFKQSYKWAAGYRHEDTTLLGFSHTHFSGAGHSDLGDFLLVPIAGDVKLDPGTAENPSNPAMARASATRTASRLAPATTPSRSTTTRCAPNSPPPRASASIAIPSPPVRRPTCCSTSDPPSTTIRARCCGRVIRLRADGTVTGMRETRGWAPGRQLYFAMRFSQAPATHELYNRETPPNEYRGFRTPGTSPSDTHVHGRSRARGRVRLRRVESPRSW